MSSPEEPSIRWHRIFVFPDFCMDDGFPTVTSTLQSEIEAEILQHLSSHSQNFTRNKHLNYLTEPLQNGLNHWFVALDASKPWILYWIFHSLDLLGKEIPTEIKMQAIETLEVCKHPSGGYGGGKDQLAHLATTYAAINTLAILGDYKSINQTKVYEFLMRMKQKDGSFRMHVGGEIDIRGSYCALSVAILLNIVTPELVDGVAEFIILCQSFEGGLGPIPGVEAHGGYTFCGLAAIGLLRKTNLLDTEALIVSSLF
jgi:protein farnesyltransferase subunit beta